MGLISNVGRREVDQFLSFVEPRETMEESVKVRSGYWELGRGVSGITGIVSQLKNRGRLIVSVNLIMRSVVVEINGSGVAPLSRTLCDELCWKPMP